VEARGMSGLGGPEGTVSDRVSVLRYSERRVLRPCVAPKNKPVRGTWVKALDLGGLGAQSGQYLASGVGCYTRGDVSFSCTISPLTQTLADQ
jgi:hypothetical protein